MNTNMDTQKNNPMQDVTLKMVMEALVEEYGWETLGKKIRINCFNDNPSVASSLKFLRRTPWAREKVENLYIWTVRKKR